MFGNVPTLCGGNDNYHHSFDSCISFQNSKWSQSHYMTVRRANTAGVQINSTTILESWLFGLHWIHHSRPNQGSSWTKTPLYIGRTLCSKTWNPPLEFEIYVVKISKIRKFNYFFSIGPPLGKNCSLAPVHTIWNSFPFNLV